MWKLLIGELASHFTESTRVTVHLEKTSELCCFVACSLHHSCGVIVGVEVNQMLSREMNFQVNNVGGFTVHVKMEDPPCSFGSSQETAINMFVYLVVTLYLERCMVMSLEDVLVDVLDRCKPELPLSEPVKQEKGASGSVPNCTLYVNVALILDREVGVVRYDGTIVDLCATHNVLPPIIEAMVNRVTLFVHRGSILKQSWILLCAPVFLVVTGRSWVFAATRSMNHNLLHYFKKLWLCLGVWPVCTDAGINGVYGAELMLLLEENEKMYVWEPSLLEFNGVYFSDWPTKDAILHDVMKEGILFQPKHPSDNVGAVRGILSRKQLPLNLWPMWICCHGNKEIKFLEVSSDRH